MWEKVPEEEGYRAEVREKAQEGASGKKVSKILKQVPVSMW